MTNQTLAIVGGSGLYKLDGLINEKEHIVETPFGAPSSPIISGRLGNTKLLFLARHGLGHVLAPHEVNYKANIFALKRLGAEAIISVSAVGSMREDIHPGDLVVVDQYIDRTKSRPSTFFGDGIVGHVMFADPVCPVLSERVYAAATTLKGTVHKGGTLMVMEGPAFSTRAESLMHRQLGVDMIGMTAMPEAKLAREAELCYCTLALATDYDSWREEKEAVTVAAVLEIMRNNVQKAQSVIEIIAKEGLSRKADCACAEALQFAVVTDRKMISKETTNKMSTIFGRIL